MKTADFIREHHACREGAKWALSIGKDMFAVWDAMIEQNKHEWLLWTATRPGVFSDSVMRKLACRFVRETPIGAGTVWDLLEDERSRKAVEMAERYADGNATDAELFAAYTDACAAADTANDAAWAAATCVAADYFAFCATAAKYTVDAARAAARAAAKAAAKAAALAAAYSADAATYSADAAAYDAARAAQARMVAELGNPFKEEPAHD